MRDYSVKIPLRDQYIIFQWSCVGYKFGQVYYFSFLLTYSVSSYFNDWFTCASVVHYPESRMASLFWLTANLNIKTVSLHWAPLRTQKFRCCLARSCKALNYWVRQSRWHPLRRAREYVDKSSLIHGHFAKTT